MHDTDKHQAIPAHTLIVLTIALILGALWLIGTPILALTLGTFIPVWLGFCILVGLYLVLLSILIALNARQ